MADTTQTQSSTTVSPTTSQENEPKKAFFGGGQEVFDNLEKFERISNPTGENQDFKFDFTDVVAEPSEENPHFQLEDTEVPLESDPGDASLAPLENVGLENIFQPSEETQQGEPTFDIEYPRLDPIDDEQSQKTSESGESAEEEQIQEEEPKSSGLEPLNTTERENPEVIPPSQETEVPFTWQQAQQSPDFPASEAQTLGEGEGVPSDGEEEKSIEEQAHLKMESEPKSAFSPLIEQFNALLDQSKTILQLENKIQKADHCDFELVGNNTEKSMITYQITHELENELPKLILKKKEKDFSRDEESEHILCLTTLEKDKNLIVSVNDYQLYEEEKDLQDPSKQLQVGNKLKKFSFLFSERLAELEEKREALKAEKEKMKAFRDIFRNF